MNENLQIPHRSSVAKRTKGATTREAIKAAAKRAMAVDGFVAVKISDIMANADRSPGAFYRHFESKEELLHELVADFQQRLRIEVNAPLKSDEAPSEHLLERLRVFWCIYREDWPIATAAFQMSMSDQRFARAWHNIRQQGIRGFAAVVRMAQSQGQCEGLQPELVASAVTSMIEYTCYNWTAKGGDFPDLVIEDSTAIEVLSRLVLSVIKSN
ncbi:MAG: HTH-type transcriptional regulator EthR [Pseudomonadota bacterium]|jgi:AcrR family transcriptional regulator